MWIKRFSIATLAVVSVLCSGCSTLYENFGNQNNISTTIQQESMAKPDDNRYMFNLTEDEIKQAILEGKKADINEYLDAQYKLSPAKSSKELTCEVRLKTPRYLIIQSASSAWKFCGFDNSLFDSGMDMHIGEARKTIDAAVKSGTVIFDVSLYSDKVDFIKTMSITLNQDNTVINSVFGDWDISSVVKMSDVPNASGYYQWKGSAQYSLTKDERLDFAKKSKIKIICNDTIEWIYDINFKDYR